MTADSVRRHHAPSGALEQRVADVEERVASLAEALRVLAHGLEDLPTTGPGGSRAAEAAREAYDLLLVAPHGVPGDRPEGA